MLCPLRGLPSGETSVVCSKHRIVFWLKGKITYYIDNSVIYPYKGGEDGQQN